MVKMFEEDSSRRSSRARKPVTYPGCDLSDDDFADTTPPPPKKAKTGIKTSKLKTTKTFKNVEPFLDLDSALRSKKTRKPPSEKLFDRELEQALQISLLETSGSQDSVPPEEVPPTLSPIKNCKDSLNNTGQEPPSLIMSENSQQSTKIDIDVCKSQPTNILKTKVAIASESKEDGLIKAKRSSLPYTRVMDNSIEILEENVEHKNKKSGKSCLNNSKKMIIKSDSEEEETSDFAPSDCDSSDGDDSDTKDSSDGSQDESDEDFSRKSKQKNNSCKKVVTSFKRNTSKLDNDRKIQPGDPKELSDKQNKKSSRAKPCVSAISKQTTTVTTSNKRIPPKPGPPKSPLKQNRSSTVSPSINQHKQFSSPSCLTAQWKPPAPANQNTSNQSTIKSPSSGLRLGLSRNMKVKPLHSSVKVT